MYSLLSSIHLVHLTQIQPCCPRYSRPTAKYSLLSSLQYSWPTSQRYRLLFSLQLVLPDTGTASRPSYSWPTPLSTLQYSWSTSQYSLLSSLQLTYLTQVQPSVLATAGLTNTGTLSCPRYSWLTSHRYILFHPGASYSWPISHRYCCTACLSHTSTSTASFPHDCWPISHTYSLLSMLQMAEVTKVEPPVLSTAGVPHTSTASCPHDCWPISHTYGLLSMLQLVEVTDVQ
jgi:hypothetical protein